MGCIAALATLVLKMEWKKFNKFEKTLNVIIIAATLFGAKESIRINKIGQPFGTIEDPAIVSDTTYPKVMLGYGGTTFINVSGNWKYAETFPSMYLYVVRNKLFVDVELWDTSHNLMAVIKKNEWELVDRNFDYNNDDNAFEFVTRGERKVIFQIELKDGFAHLSGLLLNKEGIGLNCGTALNNRGALVQFFKGDTGHYHIEDYHIKPLFKYRRDMHFGERNTD